MKQNTYNILILLLKPLLNYLFTQIVNQVVNDKEVQDLFLTLATLVNETNGKDKIEGILNQQIQQSIDNLLSLIQQKYFN